MRAVILCALLAVLTATAAATSMVRLGASLDAEASATVLLHESLFRKLTNSVLPAIIAEAKAVTIPGKKEKHFEYGSIQLSEFNISSLNVAFGAPNKVVLSLIGLSLAVPKTHFSVFDHILDAAKARVRDTFKISCSGDFWASLSGTNIDVTFPMNDVAGKLSIGDATVSVSFGSLNVNHKFEHETCRIAEKILEALIGNINKLIKDLVEKDIGPDATKSLNKALANLAEKLKIPLTTEPVATSDSIQLSLNLLPPTSMRLRRLMRLGSRRHHNSGSAASSLLRLPVLKAKSVFPARDIEVFVTQATVNTLFSVIQSRGDFNLHDVLPVNTSVFRSIIPAAYAACPDCPLEITTSFLQAPTAHFDSDASLSFTGLIAGLGGKNGSTTVPLLDLNLNGTFTAMNFSVSGDEDNTIKFKLAIPNFAMSLYRSSIGPVDVSALSGLVEFLLQDVVVPDFNKKFKGIPIKPIANVTVTDIELAFNGAADAGLDIVVPTL